MEKNILEFIQSNSPDGGFLQSEHWKKFQESVGRKTFQSEEKDEGGESIAYANIITHTLPMVGNYFYVPRGPVIDKSQIPNLKIQKFLNDLVQLADENNVGWIRVEPNREEELNLIKENLPKGLGIKKSAVDMQSREILILDISKREEEILAGMKQKTRYNIRLAEKRGVKARNAEYSASSTDYVEEFLRLTKVMAERDKITAHPEKYYREMFEVIPPEILKLYVAEHQGKIIAANLVLIFGETATYMHGASDNIHREVMAPYLLQWRQILDAKKTGCRRYDFGGVKLKDVAGKSWAGVTKFKTGFAPGAEPVRFPGCWDIVISPAKYALYRGIQKVKRIVR